MKMMMIIIIIKMMILYFSEEDTFGSYGRLLLKYFCAEAVMTGHALLLSSLDYDTQQLLKVRLMSDNIFVHLFCFEHCCCCCLLFYILGKHLWSCQMAC